MKLSVPFQSETLELDCFDNWMSSWVNKAVLEGDTYPILPFIDDVTTILDVGANCGATSVFFSACYPDAKIHAFEPARDTFGLLEGNAARRQNVSVHNIGLHSVTQQVELYKGKVDSVTSSMFQRENTTGESEFVTLRSARDWLAEHAIERIDILKVDVEGCEVAVLESMRHILSEVKVIYVEYDSKEARREIELMLWDTHWLCLGHMLLSQGEAVYLSNEVMANPTAIEAAILKLWTERAKAKQ